MEMNEKLTSLVAEKVFYDVECTQSLMKLFSCCSAMAEGNILNKMG